MKIPRGTHINTNDPLYQLWCTAALEMTVEYGIQVEVKRDYDSVDQRQEIYFEVEDHKFGCLKDLRRALKNKAFL